MSGSFCVLDFMRGTPVAHVEQRHSAAFLPSPEETQPFAEAVDLLDQQAATPEDSGEIITEHGEKHESEVR